MYVVYLHTKIDKQMKKVFAFFTIVIVMSVMVLEKKSGKTEESKLFLDNVEALITGQ